MKTFLIILLIALKSGILFGQEIYSGIWSEDDNYFDFNPDKILLQPQMHSNDSINIDLDGNGTMDFRIITRYYEGYKWFGDRRIMIEGLNQNQIAYEKLDSCCSDDNIPLFVYSTYTTKELGFNVLINDDLNWIDTVVEISYNDYDVAEPTNMGFRCARVSKFKTDTGYVATRIIGQTDTLYGWIKVSNIDYLNGNWCTIHEYACNKNSINSANFFQLQDYDIYPNPSSDKICIESRNPLKQIKNICILNSIGVIEEKIIPNSNNYYIDFSNYPKGFYIIKIQDIEGNLIEKKIIKN